MKKSLFLFLFVIVMSSLSFGQIDDLIKNSKPASTNVLNAQFPRITPDLRVIYRIKAPEGTKIQFDLANKKYDMVRDAAGFLNCTTDPQVPGFHYYRLWIDGVEVSDPASETFFGVGRMFSAIEIPSAGEDFYTIKNVPHGDIRSKLYFSKTTNEWRRIYIYCPPGYDADAKKKYPVLYIQHGSGEDQRGWAVQGLTDIILDNLIAEGKAKPMIIVSETSTARKPGEAVPQPRPAAAAPSIILGPGNQPAAAPAPRPRMNMSFDTYKEVMLNDLIPFIDGNFRTLTNGANRAMAGLSMGGMVTTSVTLTNLDKFAYIGCFSGGPRITAKDTLSKVFNGVFADAATFNKKVKVLFISNGTVEGNSPLDAAEVLKKAGLNNVFTYQSPGTAHEWLTWRRSLNQFAQLLFK
jgi:enterochelin esterase-like enzyme